MLFVFFCKLRDFMGIKSWGNTSAYLKLTLLTYTEGLQDTRITGHHDRVEFTTH